MSRPQPNSPPPPPVLGKRELLEWAAALSAVEPCRQYDDLRDGLVLLALAHAAYPDDVSARFLRTQRRPGQPREATKNWELLLRCLHRHSVPAELCAHDKVSKGHARCCFNALVLFYFLCTLTSSPGATVSARFSSPVDPRLIQFLHSPQGQRALQPPPQPARAASQSATTTTTRGDSTAPRGRSLRSRSVPWSDVSSRASDRDAPVVDEGPVRERRAGSGKRPRAVQEARAPPSRGCDSDSSPAAPVSPSFSSTSSSSVASPPPSPLASRSRSRSHSSAQAEAKAMARLPQDVQVRLLTAELEHVKAVAQLALTQQAMQAELQSQVMRSEAAQQQLELAHMRTKHALLCDKDLSVARAQGVVVVDESAHRTAAAAAATARALDESEARLHQLARTVRDVLGVQRRVCEAVLSTPPQMDTNDSSSSSSDMAARDATTTIAAHLFPLLNRVAALCPATAALDVGGLQGCLETLLITLQTLRLENSRLRRGLPTDGAVPPANSTQTRAAAASAADATDLVSRLQAAVEEQAHEIASLRTALRRARRAHKKSVTVMRETEATPTRAQPVHSRTDLRSQPSHRSHENGNADRDPLKPRNPNTTAASAHAPRQPSQKAHATTEPLSVLISAEALEQRKAAIFHKYSDLMLSHS